MSLITTPAVVLHTFKYGETSKIARLATRDYGVQSAIAKGALGRNSKFGAKLQVLSSGVAHMYVKRNRELNTLAEFEVTDQHQALAHDVGRFTAATALAELVMRCWPAEPNPHVFELVDRGLGVLESAPPERVDVTGLELLWAAVAALGFAPTLDVCARDGGPLPPGKVAFSVAQGGFLCGRCARGVTRGKLDREDRVVLEMLVGGAVGSVGELNPKRSRAHKRLLARFVERHVAEGSELRAMALWADLT
ncbi:MAG: DNA repair protein RecO [Gemmatimonadales bacterium]